MPALRLMRFDEARAKGERVVGELLRRFRQDTGNAKWIGKMAIGSIEQRLAPSRTDVDDSTTSPDTAASAAKTVTAEPVAEWRIFSAAELIDHLAVCDVTEAERILEEEQRTLARAAVIDAARRRLG